MIQSVEGEGSGFFPQLSWFFPQVLIVLELVKISGMGYASVVCLVGKRSTFGKYTQSALMHRPWLFAGVDFDVIFDLFTFHDFASGIT